MLVSIYRAGSDRQWFTPAFLCWSFLKTRIGDRLAQIYDWFIYPAFELRVSSAVYKAVVKLVNPCGWGGSVLGRGQYRSGWLTRGHGPWIKGPYRQPISYRPWWPDWLDFYSTSAAWEVRSKVQTPSAPEFWRYWSWTSNFCWCTILVFENLKF